MNFGRHHCLAAVVFVAAAATCANGADEGTAVDAEKVKTLFREFTAGGDLPEPRHRLARRQLLEMGPGIVPELQRLFRESTDDDDRAAAVMMMFAVPQTERSSIEVLGAELRRDVADWHGFMWVYAAIMKTEGVAPAEAAEMAARALSSDHHGLVSYALAVLRRHGHEKHMPAIEAFLARARANLLTQETARWASEAQTTLSELRNKARSPGSSPKEQTSEYGHLLRSPGEPTDEDAGGRFGLSSWSPWLIAGMGVGGVVLAWATWRLRR